ncbi:MAG: hypothetical protein IT353_24230, partial [Gemmatimonadaceae bacterium]|nr:hypothetical protein [Gemmatimonadaceae bacterium]
MSDGSTMTNAFAEQASTSANQPAAGELAALRQAGSAAFARLGFPTTRDEDWHYTSPSAIADATFVVATDRAHSGAFDAALLTPYLFGGTWPLLVFRNGRFAPELSSRGALPEGVRVFTLAEAAAEVPELFARHVGNAVAADRDGFSALNAAFAGEGTLIHVAKEMVSDTPIHLMHVTDASGVDVMSHPRHVIVVERHAKATVLESFIGLDDVRSFTNAVTEVYVEDGA